MNDYPPHIVAAGNAAQQATEAVEQLEAELRRARRRAAGARAHYSRLLDEHHGQRQLDLRVET